MKISTGVEAINIPDKPPMTNIVTKPIAKSIDVVNLIFPPHIVPIQLNVLIADGTAISIVDNMNVVPSVGFIPDWNM